MSGIGLSQPCHTACAILEPDSVLHCEAPPACLKRTSLMSVRHWLMFGCRMPRRHQSRHAVHAARPSPVLPACRLAPVFCCGKLRVRSAQPLLHIIRSGPGHLSCSSTHPYVASAPYCEYRLLHGHGLPQEPFGPHVQAHDQTALTAMAGPCAHIHVSNQLRAAKGCDALHTCTAQAHCAAF